MLEWKKHLADKYALLVEGARRVGKTHLVTRFVKNEYEKSVYIDFSLKSNITKESKRAFEEESSTEDLVERLALIQGVRLIPGKTCFVFDEVQRYPSAREAIKALMAFGKYHYIETGSLLGIRENVKDIVIPSEEHSSGRFLVRLTQGKRSSICRTCLSVPGCAGTKTLFCGCLMPWWQTLRTTPRIPMLPLK